MNLNKDNCDPLRKKIHWNVVVDNFLRTKGLNLHFKEMHLITGKMIPHQTLRHSLVELRTFKDYKK